MEKEINKDYGLFIRQDYSRSRIEEFQKVKNSIKEINLKIEAQVKEIKDYEENQLKQLEILGALDRFIQNVQN